jgi:hypothetical protein
MSTKLKRQEITEYRVDLVKYIKETKKLNNQQIADIFNITRENVRKLLLTRRSKQVTINKN